MFIITIRYGGSLFFLTKTYSCSLVFVKICDMINRKMKAIFRISLFLILVESQFLTNNMQKGKGSTDYD